MRFLRVALCLEIVMALVGMAAWSWNRSFWKGGSASLSMVLTLVQLPIWLIALIGYARSVDRREKRGKLIFAGSSLLCVWNFLQWGLFWMGHQ